MYIYYFFLIYILYFYSVYYLITKYNINFENDCYDGLFMID